MAGRRRSDRALRPKLKSPGRPPVARQDHRRRFWALIAEGLSSEDATMAVGISQPVGTRWFRQAGGMAPSHLARTSVPVSGRYPAFAEREEIALWRAQGLGVREVARRLGRSASTVSRELRRTRRRVTAIWITWRAPRSGTPNELPVGRNRRSWPPTQRCGSMCRTGLLVLSSRQAGLRHRGRSCRGKGDGMGDGRAVVGLWRGARSRSLNACGSTSRTIAPCASATRPSTRRSTFRAGVR